MRGSSGGDQSYPSGAEAAHRVGSKDFRKPGVYVNGTMIELGGGGLSGYCPKSRRKDGEGEEPVTVNDVGLEATGCAIGRDHKDFCDPV